MAKKEKSFAAGRGPDAPGRSTRRTWLRVVIGVIVFAAIVYFIVRNIGVFGKVALVLLGFGAVVLIHEFGHFVVAKLCGVKVEVFSIFMPPILFGLRRTKDGLRLRILPELFAKGGDDAGEGLLCFTIGKKGGEEGVEYRIGLIPFGGFVKMFGQDDIGPVKENKDPRSFANKSFIVRAAVLAAGVGFNALSAVIIFMIVFLFGINLTPPIVGGVIPNSPAALAGLKSGDEIIEINGKSEDLDFSNIGVAAALSDVNEVVRLKVKRRDGSVADFALVAQRLPGEMERVFGILLPMGLTVGKVSGSDANQLYARTGLRSGDSIRGIDGKEVRSYWELMDIVEETFAHEATLLVERPKKGGAVEQVECRMRLDLGVAEKTVKSESDLGHIYSMVPRLAVAGFAPKSDSSENGRGGAVRKISGKVRRSFGKKVVEKEEDGAESVLRIGDIIVGVGDDAEYIGNPTYKEIREVVGKSEDKDLAIRVLRADANGIERETSVTVRPRRRPDVNEVKIGVAFLLDAAHSVVAKTIDANGGPARLDIRRGAVITAVDGTKVASFYDVISQIRRYKGERITIDYRVDDKMAGDVALDVGSGDAIAVKSGFAEYIPFDDLKRPYKARGATLPSRLVNAVVMGWDRTIMFIAQSYVTLKRLIGGLVSPRSLIGPVGIIAFSYRIVAEQPFIYYVYFLGLISAVIVVFNLLPWPPFDGGLVMLVMVEKIKGSPLSERVQAIMIYSGWVLVGALIIYVTFNDIIRSFFSG
jgi:regulator of sigma E protease